MSKSEVLQWLFEHPTRGPQRMLKVNGATFNYSRYEVQGCVLAFYTEHNDPVMFNIENITELKEG